MGKKKTRIYSIRKVLGNGFDISYTNAKAQGYIKKIGKDFQRSIYEQYLDPVTTEEVALYVTQKWCQVRALRLLSSLWYRRRPPMDTRIRLTSRSGPEKQCRCKRYLSVTKNSHSRLYKPCLNI